MDQELARLKEDQARRDAEPPEPERCYLHLEKDGTWSWSWRDQNGTKHGKKGFASMFDAREAAYSDSATLESIFFEEI